jgi:hypothetical protein
LLSKFEIIPEFFESIDDNMVKETAEDFSPVSYLVSFVFTIGLNFKDVALNEFSKMIGEC